MSARVLLNFLYEFEIIDKMRGLSSILIAFSQASLKNEVALKHKR